MGRAAHIQPHWLLGLLLVPFWGACGNDGEGATFSPSTSSAGATQGSTVLSSGLTDSSLGTTDAPLGSSTSPALTPDGSGAFTLLIYNVAGLPDVLSSGNPKMDIPLISPLLNQYDIVLVQEDFAYHDELSLDAEHPYQSEPLRVATLGDGLNRFSTFAFEQLHRAAWQVCYGQVDSGSDCLTPKGFSVARTELIDGVYVDIYNLHMDAGGGDEDIAAREAQTQQLLDEIAQRSQGVAVIVAGDTNMKQPSEYLLVQLMDEAGLEDGCRVLDCGDERIDRILYRGTPQVRLTPADWRVDLSFVDEMGEDLSDHKAIGIDFSWSSGASE